MIVLNQASALDVARDMRPPATLPEGPLRVAHDYWMALPREGDLPLFERLEPADLPGDLISRLVKASGPDERGRFRVVFQGALVHQISGRDTVGEFAEDIYPQHLLEPVRVIHGLIATVPHPLLARAALSFEGMRAVETDRLALPLANRDGAVAGYGMIFDYRVAPDFTRNRLKVLTSALDLVSLELFVVGNPSIRANGVDEGQPLLKG